MPRFLAVGLHILLIFYASPYTVVEAVGEPSVAADNGPRGRGYVEGELVPVSCLNRTM
jgi:hypothetical protein